MTMAKKNIKNDVGIIEKVIAKNLPLINSIVRKKLNESNKSINIEKPSVICFIVFSALF